MANAKMSVLESVQKRLAGAGGRLPWVEVMQMALYEPGAGYYRRGVRRIGRQGDFFTSVSVGELYGSLLAELAWQVWREMDPGPGEAFLLVEQGGHDGRLARDVLEAARRRGGKFFEALRYVLIEPDEGLRQAQREMLEGFEQLEQREDWQGLKGGGMVLCNELVDAFAVHLVRRAGGEWKEWWVREEDAGLGFVEGELSSPALAEELEALDGRVAEGQVIEVNVAMRRWLGEVSASGFEGVMVVADYGHAAAELLGPERMEGTLRRYLGHRCDRRVLENLGEADLTTHVNFTRLAELAEGEGWRVGEFVEQGRFLTRLAAGLMAQPGFAVSPGWTRQFQTLTHPNQMGVSFQTLVLGRGKSGAAFCERYDGGAARRRLGMAGTKD